MSASAAEMRTNTVDEQTFTTGANTAAARFEVALSFCEVRTVPDNKADSVAPNVPSGRFTVVPLIVLILSHAALANKCHLRSNANDLRPTSANV